MDLNLPILTRSTANSLLHNAVVSLRSRWSVLKASGPGLRDYLQGQITQDMNRLTSTQGIHSCILSPQGKAISELYILEGHNDELIILTPAPYAEATVARLRQFSLDHALRIGIVDSLVICSIQGANATQLLNDFGLVEPDLGWLSASRKSDTDTFALVMPENPRGYWVINSRKHVDTIIGGLQKIDESEMEAMRIIRGIPDFGIEWDASIHPLNANLIEFDGVSFDKGCYVGQEVTSRMHWRGGIKKKLYRVAIDGSPEALPCPVRTSTSIGELKSAAIDHEQNCFGIAYLPVEIAESNSTLTLTNGVSIKVLEACHA
ncbi:MAG: folate-binding protein [Mariprofundus sp.]|nr:folate-binding protein [Mariprofundus sp.]